MHASLVSCLVKSLHVVPFAVLNLNHLDFFSHELLYT